MIPCPDCEHTGHKGKVEKTLYQCFGGTLEPVGEWVDCEDCNGSGEVECDEDNCDPRCESYKSGLAKMLDNPLETLAKLNLRGENHVGN